jgi:hypothetical protein
MAQSVRITAPAFGAEAEALRLCSVCSGVFSRAHCVTMQPMRAPHAPRAPAVRAAVAATGASEPGLTQASRSTMVYTMYKQILRICATECRENAR